MTNQIYNIGELTISYKTKVLAKDRSRVNTSRDCYDIIRKMYNENDIEYKELFGILLLNKANMAIGYQWMSQGSDSGTVVSVKFIAQAAILGNASSVILFHNHPSGNTMPSDADKRLSIQAKQALKLLDIDLIDHMIICAESYLSMADEGLV